MTDDEKSHVEFLTHELYHVKEELHQTTKELERLSEIVYDLQSMFGSSMNYIERRIEENADVVRKHTDGFHAMLIIKNKEVTKGEDSVS